MGLAVLIDLGKIGDFSNSVDRFQFMDVNNSGISLDMNYYVRRSLTGELRSSLVHKCSMWL